jgi:hypothetical protein
MLVIISVNSLQISKNSNARIYRRQKFDSPFSHGYPYQKSELPPGSSLQNVYCVSSSTATIFNKDEFTLPKVGRKPDMGTEIKICMWFRTH